MIQLRLVISHFDCLTRVRRMQRRLRWECWIGTPPAAPPLPVRPGRWRNSLVGNICGMHRQLHDLLGVTPCIHGMPRALMPYGVALCKLLHWFPRCWSRVQALGMHVNALISPGGRVLYGARPPVKSIFHSSKRQFVPPMSAMRTTSPACLCTLRAHACDICSRRSSASSLWSLGLTRSVFEQGNGAVIS